MENEYLKHIEDLFVKWCERTQFDSTGRLGHEEYHELIEYSKEHIEEFKEFAHDTLLHPQFDNYRVAALCDEIFPEERRKEEISISNILSCAKNTIKVICGKKPSALFTYGNCNHWLNYFEGTKGVNYYKDYISYSDYLGDHYLPWNPFKEDDPNPTYEEFKNNKEKYIK